MYQFLLTFIQCTKYVCEQTFINASFTYSEKERLMLYRIYRLMLSYVCCTTQYVHASQN